MEAPYSIKVPVNFQNPIEQIIHTELMVPFSIPGVVVVVAHGGKIVIDQAVGMANVRSEVAASTANYHRIASISKVFTKAAVQRLIKQGKLSLETCVFPCVFGDSINYKICANSDKITVQHLLTHTTGSWPTTTRTVDPMFFRPSMNHKLHIQSVLFETKLDNLGEYCYSNFGYCILGRVIEIVSGQPYIDFVRNEF